MQKEDKGKIRVIVFELEGSNQSLQESLRTVSGVLSRGQPVLKTPVTPALQLKNGKAKSPSTEPLFEAAQPPMEEVPGIHGETDDTEETEASTGSPTGKKRKAKTPKVAQLDMNKGPIPFRQYAEEKAPTSNFDRYVICGKWLKESGQGDAIGIDHIYTCYRLMNWGEYPKDWAVTFRDIARLKGWFETAGRGVWKLTHVGEDFANQFGKKK